MPTGLRKRKNPKQCSWFLPANLLFPIVGNGSSVLSPTWVFVTPFYLFFSYCVQSLSKHHVSTLKLHWESDVFVPPARLYLDLSCHFLPVLVQKPLLFPCLCCCAPTPTPGQSDSLKCKTDAVISLLQTLQCTYCLAQSCVWCSLTSETLFPTLCPPLMHCSPHSSSCCSSDISDGPTTPGPLHCSSPTWRPFLPGLCSNVTFVCRWRWSSHSHPNPSPFPLFPVFFPLCVFIGLITSVLTRIPPAPRGTFVYCYTLVLRTLTGT